MDATDSTPGGVEAGPWVTIDVGHVHVLHAHGAGCVPHCPHPDHRPAQENVEEPCDMCHGTKVGPNLKPCTICNDTGRTPGNVEGP